jgi:hypothetical protein
VFLVEFFQWGPPPLFGVVFHSFCSFISTLMISVLILFYFQFHLCVIPFIISVSFSLTFYRFIIFNLIICASSHLCVTTRKRFIKCNINQSTYRISISNHLFLFSVEVTPIETHTFMLYTTFTLNYEKCMLVKLDQILKPR